MTTCTAKLAYRDMYDAGAPRVCGNPAVTPNGFCRRHDPDLKPKRDARGRILPKLPSAALSKPDQDPEAARREQNIARLQVRLERAIARRKRAEERGAQACAALSDAEEAEAKARGQLAAAQVQAGLTAALKPRDAEQATATQERGK